jgi:hypothetical protein
MARENRQRLRKKFVYFFLNGKVHKVLKLSRARDEVIAWSYLDKKRMMYSYSQVEKNMEKAYSVVEVSKILGRHRVTIEEYILQGKIKQPQKVYPISNPESTWSKYMLSESDIMDIHQFIIDAGHIRELPSRSELQAILKHNLILYTKTEDGKFVPVWKAE